MSLEVIIPVKDRAEVEQCVQSLLAIAEVHRIWVCDGGSQDATCLTALQTVAQDNRVQWLVLPQSRFNKSALINQGILHSTAEILLISDADILWNSRTIQSILHCVHADKQILCSVDIVKESNPSTSSLRRSRYTYQITVESDVTQVAILPIARSSSVVRPGCGLLCTHRTNFFKLGGYQECFQGWGWEDQDLLMRAMLYGLQLQVIGSVIHLSHGDAQRNQHHHYRQPVETRDRNILTCLKHLANGNLLGDLPTDFVPPHSHRSIQIQIPEALQFDVSVAE